MEVTEFGVYFTCDLYSLCLSLGNMALEMESVEVCVALVSSKHSWANADLNVAMANESQGNRKIQENLSLFTGVSNIHFCSHCPLDQLDGL